jgi:hypothetical protein
MRMTETRLKPMSVKSSRRRATAVLAAVLATAVLATVLFLVAGPATAQEFATLRSVQGQVEVQRGEDGDFRPGRDGQTLSQGDTVRTGSDGRAEIEYFDGSVTRLDFDTTFILQELASIPDQPNSKIIETEQTEGQTFNRVTELVGAESRFETETPTATASVRGTEYVVRFLPDGSVEFWCLDGSLTITMEDGSEIVLEAGEGVRILPDGTVGGLFALTAEHLQDAFLIFNQCELDQADLPVCEEPEVEGIVVEPEEPEEEEPKEEEPKEDPAPPPPGDDTEVLGTTITGGQEPDQKDEKDKPKPEPPDRTPVVFTLSWNGPPSNLDLHVQTPDASQDAEGGEVWHGNPCLARNDGSCWGRSGGNAVGGGSEAVTILPLGSPDPGDFLPGPYAVWVENVSCQDATFAGSNASVTVTRGGRALGTFPVSGASGDSSSETWNVATVRLNKEASAGVSGSQSFSGDACGPQPPPRDQAPVQEPTFERQTVGTGVVGGSVTGENHQEAGETEGEGVEEEPEAVEEPPPTPPEPEPEPQPEPDPEAVLPEEPTPVTDQPPGEGEGTA